MFFKAFALSSMIWLQVYRSRLSLFLTLTFIVTFLPLSFYTWVLFNLFILLHCCCLLLHSLSMLWLLNMVFLAVFPLIIRAEEDVVAEGIPATPLASQVVRIIMATMMVLGSRTVTMREIDINSLTRFFHQIDGLHSLQIFLPLLPSQYQLSQTHEPPPPPLQFRYHNLYLCFFRFRFCCTNLIFVWLTHCCCISSHTIASFFSAQYL